MTKKNQKNHREQRTGSIGHKNYGKLIQMIEEGMTAFELSDIFEVAPETIRKFARKRGLKIQRVDMSLENHPLWSGGTTLDRSGYILQRVEVDSEHGYLIRALRKGDKRGYAPIHRIVMHDKLGRKLRPQEVVDHIDGDVKNNHPDNLRVFENNTLHLKETLKGKTPNWSEEGFANMCAPRPHYKKKQK